LSQKMVAKSRPNNLIIRSPKTPEEFKEYYKLRWEILRKPWKQPEGSEKDEFEDRAFHLMALEGDSLLGVGRIHFNSPTEAQLRFMAVKEEHRDGGIGGALISGLEDEARKRGVNEVVVNARKPAVGFYSKYGYELMGDAHTLFGSIPHYSMRKNL